MRLAQCKAHDLALRKRARRAELPRAGTGWCWVQCRRPTREMPTVDLPRGPRKEKVLHTVKPEGRLWAESWWYMDLARWVPRSGDSTVKGNDLRHVLEDEGDKRIRRGGFGIFGEGCRDELGSSRYWQWRMLRLLARPRAASR